MSRKQIDFWILLTCVNEHWIFNFVKYWKILELDYGVAFTAGIANDSDDIDIQRQAD